MIDSIIQDFEVWTDAQGVKSKGRAKSIDNISLEGIARLRQLILELAVRGKLVQQDPTEGHALDLLIGIDKEKARLEKKGFIGKFEKSIRFSNDQAPYKIPSNWIWTRLTDIYYSISPSGKKLKTSDIIEEGSYPVVDQGKCIISGYTNNSELLIEIPGPIIIFGDHTKEIKYIDFNFVAGADGTKILRPYNINERYFYFYLYTCDIEERGYSRHFKYLNENLFALPPLNEQNRIVEKISELMSLCDKLEVEQTNNLNTHHHLVKCLLETLTQANDTDELQIAWKKVSLHFNTLFCTVDSIEQLKETILHLAIMGSLVKQNPNDEPASVLLEKIATEKAKLIRVGVIKKEKQIQIITDSEKPFNLPNSWSWCRLEDLCLIITKGSSPKWQGVSYTENHNDVLFITSENVGSYELLLDTKKFVETKFNEIEPKSILQNGDFLMNIVGGSIGRTAIFNIDEIANINQAVCLIRTIPGFIESQFLLHFFNSSICISYMFDKQVDNARANLSMANISKFVIPIPPLSEQHQIVKRLTELNSLCDLMKEHLIESQILKNSLSKIVVDF